MKESYEINLKDIWDKEDIYIGLTRKDLNKLKELDYPEWLARSNIVDDVVVGELLRMTGIVED
jgi:hypothetical protein